MARRVLILTAVFVCCFVAAAGARRLAHGREKTAIVAAIRRSHDIGPSQTASCMRVYISTVNGNWATMQFIPTGRCASQAANGVAIVHRKHGRWKFVTAGSAFTCPIPGHIPSGVRRDLKLGCIPG
jgi:uncharacterized membrane protein